MHVASGSGTGDCAASAPTVTIRSLLDYTDLMQCVALQQATWGDDCREIVPPAVLLVAQKVGGLAIGAFDETGAMIGTLFGMTGVVDGEPLHWSHMLAVREDWRDRGIGMRLKEDQRRRVVAMGMQRVRWTFDPLVARNAHLNVHRLRVRVLEYVESMYGDSPFSDTDSVIGSDRLVVEWRLVEPPPERMHPDPSWPRIALEAGVNQPLPRGRAVQLEVPRDIQALKRADPERAVAWRRLTRRALERYLDLGYGVADFRRGHQGRRGCYLLTPSGAAP